MAIKDALSGIYQLARDLTGSKRKEGATSDVGYARIYGGEAIGDSVDGIVTVKMTGADVVSQDGTNHLEVQTSPSVKAGDMVMVANVNGSGSIIYAPGEGDRQNAAIATATQVANDAKAIADAVDQHFWADGNGVHVSTDADDPAGDNNILINALGLLLRAQTDNLVSISQTATAFYDGNGNNASNITAQFGGSGAVIGYAAGEHLEVDSNSVDIVNNGVVKSTFGASEVSLGKDSISTAIKMCADSGWITATEIGPQKQLGISAQDFLNLVTRTSYPGQSLSPPTFALEAPYVENGVIMNKGTISANADVVSFAGTSVTKSELQGMLSNAAVQSGTVGTIASGDTSAGYWKWWKFQSGLCIMMAKFKTPNLGMTQEWYQSYLTPGTFSVTFPVTLVEPCVCCLMQPSTGNVIGGWISGQGNGTDAQARAYIPANRSVTSDVWWFCLFAGRWK